MIADYPLDIVGAQAVNVMISEDGRRLWVCTEGGTVLRIKSEVPVTLDDMRVRLVSSWDGDE